MIEAIPYRPEPQWNGRTWTGAYSEYLKTEWWGIARRYALVAQRFTCQDCCWRQGMGGGRWLEVHHLTYDRLGDERLVDLRVLCSVCHAIQHGKAPRFHGPQPIGQILGRVLGSMLEEHERVQARRLAAVGAP